MKRSIVVLCLFLLQPGFAQSVKTWSSPGGHSFQGTFVRMEGQAVVLRGTDGNEIAVPLQRLSEDSQKLAQLENQQALKNQPVFTHQNRYFRFELHPNNSWLKVQFLQGTQVVNNETYEIGLTLSEVRPPNKWSQSRVKEMIGQPEKGRNDVSISFLMENGVKLKFTVDLDDKAELSYSFEPIEVPKGLPTLDLRTGMRFPTLLDYDMDTESYIGPLSSDGVVFQELPSFLEGYEIEMKKWDGKKEVVPYHEKQSGSYSAQSFVIKAPRKKDLVLDAPSRSEDGSLHVWFYNGKSPFQGYSIRSQTHGRDNLKAGPFSISVR